MRITADTNVLLRAVLPDDDAQRQTAIEALTAAETVAISVTSLCEFVWVLERRYRASRVDVIAAIRRLIETHNVSVDHPAVEAGLSALETGGDFADGVIAHDGRWLGGETFVSFDRKAVKLMTDAGQAALLLT